MTDLTIQPKPSCKDDSDAESLQVDKALEKIQSAITPIQHTENIRLHEALNRTLAEDVIAAINMPAHASSAMDGYAIKASDIPQQGIKQLRLAGRSLAGRPYNESVKPGTGVRIMTGAILPDGTDTVVIQENVQINGDIIAIDSRTRNGENVRPIGENFMKGDILLGKGSCLYPADLGLIASSGLDEISVFRKIRVAFFSTGDELRSPGERLDPGDIYDSNRYTLSGMLLRLGVQPIDLGIVRDNRDAINAALQQAVDAADAVIISGGVSVGDADFTREILQKTGTIAFWKVAIKPGRPLVFGRFKHAWFFGLPGNPVSTIVTFYQFVQPALKLLAGIRPVAPLTMRVVCTSNLKKRPGRQEYQRGILQKNTAGEYIVSKTGKQGSGILSSMTQANCFIVLPVENDGVMAGDTVVVQPFFGII